MTDLKLRTKAFAISIVNFCNGVDPHFYSQRVILQQLIRAATSVGANYRATQRALSERHFAAKMGIVIEEADEYCYWLEILMETTPHLGSTTAPLLKEANELTAIFVSSKKRLLQN